MDKLDFLDGSQEPSGEAVTEAPAVEAVTEAPVVAEEPQETPEQIATRERDERGRFKAKEAEEPVMVPLKALHETRDEVKALKAQLDALNAPRQQNAVPDIFEDPEAYQSHIANSIQQATLNATLNLSEEMVRGSAGNEVVDAAQQWGAQAFQANPALFQQFVSQRNPYGFLVQEYQRHTALSKLGDPKDIDAFLAWRTAQQAIQQPAETPIQQPAPPQSIASAPSAGGIQQMATGPGVAFSETIK